MNKTATLTQELTNIGFLDAGECEFYRNPNGFLALKYKGEDYKRVQALRALPLTIPGAYICVHDMDNKEIGIIESLELMPKDIAALLCEELENRYFCPEISDISSIKEKMGFYYFDVLIGSHKKTFSVKDISKSIKQLKSGAVMLTDVDGNRYLIPDITKITAKYSRQLEPYLS